MNEKNRGIIFYNSGLKCLPRLLVAVKSLRDNYKKNISIISEEDSGYETCKNICEYFGCDLVKTKSSIKQVNKFYWYEKARMHNYTPYNTTIFMDSDTLTLKTPEDLFETTEENEFCATQFSNWRCNKVIIKKRLLPWSKIDEQLYKKTIQINNYSVNAGVFSFVKDSELMKNWFDFTINIPNAVLPEESTCHLLLNKYKGKIVESKYNCSCKHDDPNKKDTRIIHYHGRKHCRKDKEGNFIFNSHYWVNNFIECFEDNICDIKNWYNKCGDRYLEKIWN